MRVRRFEDPEAFRQAAWPLLLEHEAENNLMLGVAGRLVNADGSALMGIVAEDTAVVSAFLQTPPYKLILSRLPAPAARAVAQFLRQEGMGIPGALGPRESVEAFVTAWMQHALYEAHLEQSLRVYQLDRVVPPPVVPGECVPATLDDLQQVLDWGRAFVAETHVEEHDMERSIRLRAEQGNLYLWRHGQAVSMAALAGPTPHGIRVSLVYTPPARRCRGYASALVAAVSQRALDSGRQFCFLFTDLANPTSNSIYQRIGYRAVCDFAAHGFGGPAGK